MKYIMLETSEGQKLPIIFPDTLNHVDVAAVAEVIVRQRQGVQCATVSAGFVGLGDDVTVSGFSESLGGIVSNPFDAMRIMAGEAVAFMPDVLVRLALEKAGKEQS